jgi:hypothetical protein
MEIIMKKFVSLAVAASVIALSSAAFAAGTPTTHNSNNAKPVAVKIQNCSKLKSEHAKAKCEKQNAKIQHNSKAPVKN